MKEKDKTLEKITKQRGERQPSRKRTQNNDSEDDPGFRKKNGEDARNVYQRPRRIKELTEMNNTLSSVQSLSCVQLFATPWTAAHQASLSITNSWSLLKFQSIELVTPSNHLLTRRNQ